MAEETTPEAHELEDRDIVLEILQLALRDPAASISNVLELVLQLGRVDLLTEAQEMQALLTQAADLVVSEEPPSP